MVGSQRTVRALFSALIVLSAVAALLSPAGLTPHASVASEQSSALTIRARGETGEEQMEVRVGGEVLAEFTVGTEWRDYIVETSSADLAPDVQVALTNDRSRPRDRNLWVDWVRFGGETYQTDAPETYSTGVWARGARCRPGHYRFEGLACNGYFGFGDLQGSPLDMDDVVEEILRGELIDEVAASETAASETAASETADGEGTDGGTTDDAVDRAAPDAAIGDGDVTIVAAGSVGSELIELRLGGEVVSSFELPSSPDLQSSPAFGLYRYQHGAPVGPGDLSVAFVNDKWEPGYDRNVRVSSISIDGATYDGDDLRLGLSPGANDEVCRRRWTASRILSCNGVVTIDADLTSPAESATTETPPPSETAPPVEAAPPSEAVPSVETDSEPSSSTRGDDGLFHPPVLIPDSLPTPAASTAATGRFYVVGRDIVDPNGDIFYPIGANVAIKFTPYGYVFEGNNGGIGDHVADAVVWNWNTVRATLICDNTSGVPTFDELIAGIDPAIQRLTDAGIVVILECHDLSASDPTVGSAGERRVRRFWDEMTNRYHDNPYVWFNLFNEPYASENTADWARLHGFYVDRIRAAGAENIIVADLPYWGQGIELLGTSGFADDLNERCNTVFGWHAYGSVDKKQGTLADHERAIRAAQAKDMALIVGEFGVATPVNWGNAGPWPWNITGFESMAELGPRFGIGLLWWHATGDTAYYSLYALKNDRSGFWTAGNSGNLTPYGQKFWDLSQRASHSQGPFTGDLAGSNCLSVNP